MKIFIDNLNLLSVWNTSRADFYRQIFFEYEII